MTEEVWVDVDGFPLYRVSNLGRVMSLQRSYARRNRKDGRENVVLWTERIIDGWTKRRNGKPEVKFVALRRDGRTATARVSHLVLTAFVGPRPEGMEACHNDGNAENNRVENLRWDTHESNIQDAVRHGTKTDPPVHIGEEHHNSRLTDEQVREILSFTPKLGLNAELSRKYGISQTSIGRIRSGKQRQIRAPQ